MFSISAQGQTAQEGMLSLTCQQAEAIPFLTFCSMKNKY